MDVVGVCVIDGNWFCVSVFVGVGFGFCDFDLCCVVVCFGGGWWC